MKGFGDVVYLCYVKGRTVWKNLRFLSHLTGSVCVVWQKKYSIKLAADYMFLRLNAAFDASKGGRLTDVLLQSLEESCR
jgi:hypothetical protein